MDKTTVIHRHIYGRLRGCKEYIFDNERLMEIINFYVFKLPRHEKRKIILEMIGMNLIKRMNKKRYELIIRDIEVPTNFYFEPLW